MEAVEGSHDADDRVGHGEDHEDHEVDEGENEDENADVVVEEREGTDEMRFVMM